MSEINTPGAIATWKELADWFNETAYDGTLFDVDGNLNIPDWRKWGNEFKSFTARNGYIDGGGGIWIRVSDTSPTTPLAPSSNNPKIYSEYGYTSAIPSWSKGSATTGSVTGTITGGSAKVGQKLTQTTVDSASGKITTATVGGTILGSMTLGDLLLGSALGIGLGVKFVDFFPDQATDFSNFCLLPMINYGIIDPAEYETTRVGLTNVLREHNDEQGNKLITPYAPYESIEKGLQYLLKIGAFKKESVIDTPVVGNQPILYEIDNKEFKNIIQDALQAGNDEYFTDNDINLIISEFNKKVTITNSNIFVINVTYFISLNYRQLAVDVWQFDYSDNTVFENVTEIDNLYSVKMSPLYNNGKRNRVYIQKRNNTDLTSVTVSTTSRSVLDMNIHSPYRPNFTLGYYIDDEVSVKDNYIRYISNINTQYSKVTPVKGLQFTDYTPLINDIKDLTAKLQDWKNKNGWKVSVPSYDENGNPNGVREQWYLPIPTPDPSVKTSPDYTTPTGLYEPTNVPDNDPNLQNEILDRLKDIENQLPSNPEYKPTPTPPSDDTGEINTPSSILGNNGQGLWSVYNPSLSQINEFGAWLWSSDIWEQIKQFFSDPMQGIIGLHKIYCKPTNGDTKTIIAGYLDSRVSSPTVTKQYERIDCGSLACAEYYGSALDYSPFTDVAIYLPFVGVVNLNVNEVMGSILHVYYDVDILTGACLATIEVKDSSNTIVSLYQYNGVCAVQIPLTSGNYGSVIASLVTTGAGVVATVASGGALAPVLIGGAVSALSSGANIRQSGSIGSNVGAMAQKKPYLIISRKIPYMALNYNNFEGFPSNNNVYLGNLTGYVRTKKVYIASSIATQNEKEMIEELLNEGVYV